MTSNELLSRLGAAAAHASDHTDMQTIVEAAQRILALEHQLETAVETTREACALLCEKAGHEYPDSAAPETLADRIRSRGAR